LAVAQFGWDIDGNPRPQAGGWDAGADQPPPRTEQRASLHP
jgi:hypothetical protein